MPAYERSVVSLTTRTHYALALVLAVFGIFAMRLWYLQIIQGDYFRDRSENNRLRQVFIPPPRGLIYDRNGTLLARNRPSFEIDLVPEDSPNPTKTVEHLATLIDRDMESLLKQLGIQRRRRPFEPRLLVRDAPRDMVARVLAHRYELPGVVVNVIPAREYVYHDLAAHVLGYIGEVQSTQLERPYYAGYRPGDIVGQFGIESQWEKYLQGQRGIQEVIVNAGGTKIGEASFERERPGHSITLTLDLDVQRAADNALADKRGAIVAMDPRTGEILALSSGPRFDPNIFVGEISRTQWLDVVQGDGKKLNNRAVQGTYPPGSVFKIFMAVAALAEGVMTTKEHVNCPGFFTVGSKSFKCHKHSGHGLVDHLAALTMSCDVFFYVAGQRLGVDRIYEYATKFGMGKQTGIELGSESKGLIPSTLWKQRAFANRSADEQRWYPGETPSVVIGQGAVTTTPLQITRGVAALVNGGNVLKPQLIKKIESADGSFHDENFGPEIQSNLGVEPSILQTVKDDLVSVVNSPSGTGRRAQLPKEWGITVAGKTGTAQVAGLEFHRQGGQFEHHAWFVGYAPAQNPEIVVTAILENAGGGGAFAAPAVQQVMQAYFSKKLGLPIPDPNAPKTGAAAAKLQPVTPELAHAD